MARPFFSFKSVYSALLVLVLGACSVLQTGEPLQPKTDKQAPQKTPEHRQASPQVVSKKRAEAKANKLALEQKRRVELEALAIEQRQAKERAWLVAEQNVWLALSCKDLALIIQGPQQRERVLNCQPQAKLSKLSLKPGRYIATQIHSQAQGQVQTHGLAEDKSLSFVVPKRRRFEQADDIYIGHIGFALMHLNKRKVVSGFHIEKHSQLNFAESYLTRLAYAPSSDVERFFSYCAKACRSEKMPDMYLQMSPSFDALHCHCIKAGADKTSKLGFFNRYNQVEFYR